MRGWVGLYSPDHSTLLTKFGPHSHYGELTMMSGEPRSFNLVALTHAEVLELCLSDVLDATKTLTLAARQLTSLLGRKDIYKPSLFAKKLHLTKISNKLKITDTPNKNDYEMIKETIDQLNISSKCCNDEDEVEDEDDDLPKKYNTKRKIIIKYLIKLLLPFTIRPQSNFLRIWTIFSITSSILAAFLIPIQTVFYYDYIAVWIVSYSTDLIALINVYIMLHSAYYSDRSDIKGSLIRHPISTALRYFKRNSGFDLLCLFPLEIFYMLLPQPSRNVLQTICLLRLYNFVSLYFYSKFKQNYFTLSGGIESCKF